MSIVKFTKNNSFQRIKLSYIDETVELDKKDREKKTRLEHIWGLRVDEKYSPNQCVELIIKKHGVSRATAYRDYSESMQIFGDIDQAHKEAEKKILAENYWNLYQLCMVKENYDGARKALDSYKEIFEFGANENALDINKMMAHEYTIKMPRWMYKKFGDIAETGVADFMGMNVEDVEFAEVQEENPDEDDE